MRILDAGCGEGRNLPYFVRNGFDLWGVDTSVMALRLLRMQGKAWHTTFDPEKFMESDIADLPLPSAGFDAVICCAVLHFAHHEAHFFRITDELLRVLKPGGSIFIRMNWEEEAPRSAPETRWVLTPDLLDRFIQRYSLQWIEPLRIERVVGELAQSTLVLEKAKDALRPS